MCVRCGRVGVVWWTYVWKTVIHEVSEWTSGWISVWVCVCVCAKIRKNIWYVVKIYNLSFRAVLRSAAALKSKRERERDPCWHHDRGGLLHRRHLVLVVLVLITDNTVSLFLSLSSVQSRTCAQHSKHVCSKIEVKKRNVFFVFVSCFFMFSRLKMCSQWSRIKLTPQTKPWMACTVGICLLFVVCCYVIRDA